MNKIVITGGSGFIGTNLVQYYLKNGWLVMNIDCAPPRNYDHIECFRKVNILNASELIKEIKTFEPDYLIHLAARTDLDAKADIKDYAENIQGVENVITACNSCKTLKRVIFASSMLVCRFGYAPKNEYDYAPNTIYGASKVISEKIIRNTAINPEWLIIRPTSIWGPWFGAPYYNLFRIILSGRFVHPNCRFGTATYGYVENSVYQINQLMHKKIENSKRKVFYIGDNPPLNLSEWADEIASLAGLKKPITIPYFLIRAIALLGDVLSGLNLSFPLNSFRLRNMIMDNIVDILATESVVGKSPVSILTATQNTLKWMNDER